MFSLPQPFLNPFVLVLCFKKNSFLLISSWDFKISSDAFERETRRGMGEEGERGGEGGEEGERRKGVCNMVRFVRGAYYYYFFVF